MYGYWHQKAHVDLFLAQEFAADQGKGTSGSRSRAIASLAAPSTGAQLTAAVAAAPQAALPRAVARLLQAVAARDAASRRLRLLQRCPPRSSPPGPPPPAVFTSARPRLGRAGAVAARSRPPRSPRRRADAPSPWPALPPGSPQLSGVSSIPMKKSCVPFERRPGSAVRARHD